MDRPNQKGSPYPSVWCSLFYFIPRRQLVACFLFNFFYLPVIGLLVFLVPLVQDTVLPALVPVVDAHLESVGLPHVWLLFWFKKDTKNSNRKRTPLIHGETNQELWLIRFIIEAIFCKFSPPWHAYKYKYKRLQTQIQQIQSLGLFSAATLLYWLHASRSLWTLIPWKVNRGRPVSKKGKHFPFLI